MPARDRILLINPAITSRQNARFPLSLMNLAVAIEDRYEVTLIDGNLDERATQTACEYAARADCRAAGITVMGGPQVATAIEVSRALRRADADLPIIWGGYFPTLYPDTTLNCDYVDYAVRGQGEDTLAELLAHLPAGTGSRFGDIDGLSWREAGRVVHNPARRISRSHVAPVRKYALLGDPRAYLARTFLGHRTAGHQAALGCRFRCTFCGVAAMFEGATMLPPPDRLDEDLKYLRHVIGADSIQFFDHNFFDSEVLMLPLLKVLARHQLPWWCYARADALLNLSPAAWELVRRSRLRMAYIGAETPNDAVLRSIRKGTRADQTLAVVELCGRHGVIPELSFMVAPPENPDDETEATFEFIRRVKEVNPRSEIIVYIHTPLPASSVPNASRLVLPRLLDVDGHLVSFPETPDGWTETRWVDYACHADAPWLTDRLRQRIRDFVTVLRCRFPTVQDTRLSPWSRTLLRGLAGWRYALRRYDRPWELNASDRLLQLRDPRATSL